MRVVPPTLISPQSTEAHRGPQLQRPCALSTSDFNGPMETSFSFDTVINLLRPKQLASDPVQLGLPPTLFGLLNFGEAVGERLERLVDTTSPSAGFSQQAAIV
jgi:hypothetical protein